MSRLPYRFHAAPPELPDPDDEIHLWCFGLDRAPLQVDQLRWCLAQEEAMRAARLRGSVHRRRYIVARATLRILLARYLGADARELRFQYGAHGKPTLVPAMAPSLRPTLHFNATHSEGFGMIAVSRACVLGIDVERVVDLPDADIVAERYFSLAERDALRRMPPEERSAAFYRCWTRKEAFIKAIGDGLAFPLHRFDVSLAADAPARLLAIDGDAEAAACWSLHSFEPMTGYIAALAAPASLPVSCWASGHEAALAAV